MFGNDWKGDHIASTWFVWYGHAVWKGLVMFGKTLVDLGPDGV